MSPIQRLLYTIPLLVCSLSAQTWIKNPANGHLYALTPTKTTWDAAEALARKHGGHLATVRSAKENSWLISTFGLTQSKLAFAGFNDAAKKGKWVWSSGETPAYTNWAKGEPNNSLGIEHYLQLGYYAGGKWNDGASGIKYAIHALMEIVTPWCSGAPSTVSLSRGGTQELRLSGGAKYSKRLYFVLGSMFGTSPGWSVGGVKVPLNFDFYTMFTAMVPNGGLLTGAVGYLDGNGDAKAAFTLPPGVFSPVMLNTKIHHAYIVFGFANLGVSAASNPVSVVLTK